MRRQSWNHGNENVVWRHRFNFPFCCCDKHCDQVQLRGERFPPAYASKSQSSIEGTLSEPHQGLGGRYTFWSTQPHLWPKNSLKTKEEEQELWRKSAYWVPGWSILSMLSMQPAFPGKCAVHTTDMLSMLTPYMTDPTPSIGSKTMPLDTPTSQSDLDSILNRVSLFKGL